MEHKLGQMQCCVAHFDERGNPLPACIKCLVCGEWVEYPYNSECKGGVDEETI